MKEQIDAFMSDANRLIEAFLKAGADPDKLGHPYPFSYEAVKARILSFQVPAGKERLTCSNLSG